MLLKSEHVNPEPLQDSLLLRWFSGNADAVRKFRRDMDRKEQAQLRLAIARGAERDRPGERVTTPAASPPIDKAKLAAWLRGELAKSQAEVKEMVRTEVAALRQDLEVKQAEAIIEGLKLMEDRSI